MSQLKTSNRQEALDYINKIFDLFDKVFIDEHPEKKFRGMHVIVLDKVSAYIYMRYQALNQSEVKDTWMDLEDLEKFFVEKAE